MGGKQSLTLEGNYSRFELDLIMRGIGVEKFMKVRGILEPGTGP